MDLRLQICDLNCHHFWIDVMTVGVSVDIKKILEENVSMEI